jgi:hypothetical protein
MVVQHAQGPVLIIATARAPSLVPCVEAGRLKYFFRVGDSTLPIPEYLITDLVLGRRQHPFIDLKVLDHSIDTASESKDMTIRFSVENLSLVPAEEIRIGVVFWFAGDGYPALASPHLRSYLDVHEPVGPDLPEDHLRLIYVSNQSSGRTVDLRPFEAGHIDIKTPLSLSNMEVRVTKPGQGAKVRRIGAVYVMPKGSPPTWFELEIEFLAESTPRLLGLTRKGSERPRVTWNHEWVPRR